MSTRRAHDPVEIARLRHAVLAQGLVGIYYANRGLFLDRYRYGFDDPRYEPYWDEVRRLGIPVFWEILGTPLPTAESYLREIDRLNRWADHYPDIRCVLTHGIAPNFCKATSPTRWGVCRYAHCSTCTRTLSCLLVKQIRRARVLEGTYLSLPSIHNFSRLGASIYLLP